MAKLFKSGPVLLVSWCAVIFIGSSLPGASVSKDPFLDFLFHKLIHLVEYAVLFVFSFKTFDKRFIYAMIFVLVFAVSDEYHQTFVYGREGRVRDVVVDLMGALLGVIILWRYKQILPEKLKNWLEI